MYLAIAVAICNFVAMNIASRSCNLVVCLFLLWAGLCYDVVVVVMVTSHGWWEIYLARKFFGN